MKTALEKTWHARVTPINENYIHTQFSFKICENFAKD